jgi:RNA polymerase sigma-70 factor (ECF subfamily)
MEIDPDTVLMKRLVSDDSALNQLMERWQASLASFIFRYTGSHEDALDLTQETFVRVYQNRLKYEARGTFSAWLFTIAANLCRNHARWRERHPTVSLHAPGDEAAEGENLADQLSSSELSPLASAEQQDLRRAVRQQIHQLPHDLRIAVLLFEYEQLSHAEIGQTLGCSAKAVEARLYRARERLRQGLASWRLGSHEIKTENGGFLTALTSSH